MMRASPTQELQLEPFAESGEPTPVVLAIKARKSTEGGLDSQPPIPHKVPEARRQIPPRAARPGAEENPVDHRAVVVPPVPLPRMRRQQRRQARPLLISQVVPIQAIIHPP
jgi:hypothetical protein